MSFQYDILTIFLCSKKEEVKHVKYTFSILNSKLEETYVLTFDQNKDFSIGWGNDFISKTELMKNAAELLPGNTLTILLRVSISQFNDIFYFIFFMFKLKVYLNETPLDEPNINKLVDPHNFLFPGQKNDRVNLVNCFLYFPKPK
jgi:hypothetical protein